jgi:hypothetical protein
VEALLDLGANGPVAVPAVALVVDGRRVRAADAVFEHGGKTAGRPRKLRPRGIVSSGEDRLRPCRSGLFGFLREGFNDGCALILGGLRRDLEVHRQTG